MRPGIAGERREPCQYLERKTREVWRASRAHGYPRAKKRENPRPLLHTCQRERDGVTICYPVSKRFHARARPGGGKPDPFHWRRGRGGKITRGGLSAKKRNVAQEVPRVLTECARSAIMSKEKEKDTEKRKKGISPRNAKRFPFWRDCDSRNRSFIIPQNPRFVNTHRL